MMYQIAIDGPSGAGKSSLAKAVAAKLGIVYVDTGALYRTIGYYAVSQGIDPKDTVRVTSLLNNIHIELKFENGTQYVYLNGENLGDKIRRPEISMAASDVSKIPAVREFLLETQKSIARTHSVIMDGRDIGTVILPNADVKIFLFASDEARALRRTKELEAKGMTVSYEDVLREMRERDAQDRNREVAPAVPAEDAIPFDNSAMTVEESIEKLLEIVRERIPSAR
jgi:cytidylate kinase